MKAKRKSTNPRTRQVLDTLRVVKRDVQKKLDIEALLVEMQREAQGVIDNTPFRISARESSGRCLLCWSRRLLYIT